MPTRPLIGITVDNPVGPPVTKYECSIAYAECVREAGGLPVMLPQEIDLIDDYLDRCDGILTTGGDDPDMTAFGIATHPEATLMTPRRQAFEMALLAALDGRRDMPVLGVCMGMQLMALHHGGRLDQHLPDILPNAEDHRQNRRHPIVLKLRDSVLDTDAGEVVSAHHQAVRSAGRLRVVATAPDGTIEAIDAPADDRPFYLGVQWHPERGDGGPLSRGLIARFVTAAARATR